jgi:Domain of unknown function (DUF4419)
VSVVINTPVRPQTTQERFEETTRAGRYGNGSVPRLAGAQVHLTSNQEFLAAALGRPRRFHYASRDKLHVVSHPAPGYRRTRDRGTADYEPATVSLGIQAIHQAFAAHVPLSLTPDLLWYMIVHEVAEYLRQNPGRHAAVFTGMPESRQAIVVRDDSLRRDEPSAWQRSVNLVREPLRAMIGGYTMDLFLPRFSTTSVEAQTALLIALMDVASPFYEFGWVTGCGIPQIRLEGEAADWQSLHFRADRLAREFDGLSGYFADLLPVLQTIAETAGGMTPDEEFWRSIYKYDDGSGGPYVTGWITAFFAYLQTKGGPKFKGHHGIENPFNWRRPMYRRGGGYRTNMFPSHVSTVPFVWDYLGALYNMTFAAGVTGVDFDDDTFLAPRLGYAVVEA